MINPEREASEKQLPNGSTISTEVQNCATFFCTTLSNLNKISQEQMEGVLQIAITAAEVAYSLSLAKREESAKTTAKTNGGELAGLAGQFRSTVERLSQSNISLDVETVADKQSAAASTETFCNMVEASLNQAIVISWDNQQKLYSIGQQILASAAVLLFSAAAAAGNSEVQGTQGISK